MMPIGHEQSLANTLSTTSLTRSISPKAVGNLIIVYSGTADPTASLSIADSGSHTWTPLTGPTVHTAVDVIRSWYTFALSVSATTITITKTGGSGVNQFMNVLIDEFNGVSQTNGLDKANSAVGNSTTPTSPAVVPDSDNELIWSGCNDSITAPGTGYTKGADDGAGDWSEYQVLGVGTSGVSQTANYTGTTGDWQAHVATFRAASNPKRVHDTVPMRTRTERY